MEKRSLGRGLSALIPPKEIVIAAGGMTEDRIVSLDVKEVNASKYQPRSKFDAERLEELTRSIRAKGVVQPILVRKSKDGYEIIAGERRLRAAKSLGMETIPAIVKDADDLSLLELSLIENIQREDLNAMEEASAYQRLISDFSFTQEMISQALGKDRSTVANMLRLLTLPRKVQEYIADSSITAGHGKAILSLPSEQEQLRVCNLVVKKAFSVRETERLIGKRLKGTQARSVRDDSNVTELEDELRKAFGTRVRILRGKDRGKIQIEYYSQEDLNRIVELLRSHAAAA